MTNLLFVCSRNQWRSPTAETIWRRRPGFTARSAGTSPNARKPVGPADIRWADVIFVMERKHQQRLQAQYAPLLEHKQLHVLEIPDDFHYMDPELVTMLEDTVTPYLTAGQSKES
ncbi:phosphotyrosine protein phosphatase [Pseudomonas tructae]|uniref:Phosphotyrosine protein phosphatase n=1 Tax=Pseudomonas tructae TaxID=2518644 RepID=A0A411MKA6_9PSED|nr:phosphotyrosine protein phosphatase [Pseudomonas tructae]QBF27222.1 phosphotyrosine protein phosphatase [Pseudomonas tructae]